MTDRAVPLGSLLATLAWAASAAVLVLAWMLDIPYLGTVGVALSMVATTATVRTYFVKQSRMMRNAFELGRDSVTPMRSTR